MTFFRSAIFFQSTSPFLFDQISHNKRAPWPRGDLVLHHREEGGVHRPGRLGVGEVGSGEGDLESTDGGPMGDFWWKMAIAAIVFMRYR